ncbi:hypothetical protein FDP41_007785 [Naegleria fowleri]|uniref:EF-hand domain-containing protein n=1 Tax=Naegleria fowleri TaxID=5763 RepID=A0A6A5CE66_NAEFO|nr:uncharacterized protein FDP41_007785 [Naegleria fowleri]KAF0983870.1 hypothetical protein FDP41_007785 [Naegleria fowleri]CAG4716538.1 unnamed protein product [Naegleria fowleri]
MKKISEKEKAIIEELFRKYDLDNDDKMDLNELDRLLSDMGFNFSKEETEAIHLFLDKDGSNALCFKEFYECWEALASKNGILRPEKLTLLVSAAKMFKSFDHDNDSSLSADEFKHFYDILSTKYNDLDSFEVTLKSLDKDGSQTVRFHDFVMVLNWFTV